MINKSNFERWFIVVVLAVLLASNTCFAGLAHRDRLMQMERNEDHRVIYAEHAEQARALIKRQREMIAGASDNYRVDAYAPTIDRIAEQQLIAAEYQLLLLQIIAQQNAQMIELLAARP